MKKITAKQINLFEWVNPAPSASHPIPRAFQPEWRFGASVPVAGLVELALRDMLGIKLQDDLAIEEQAERELLERESHLEVLGMDFEASTAYWEAREMEDGNEPF